MTRSASGPRRGPATRRPRPDEGGRGRAVDVGLLLEAWVARGLLSREQADRIREADPGAGAAGAPEAAPRAVTGSEVSAPAGSPGPSLVVEALGYLGGALVLAAVGLLAAEYWETTALPVRLGPVALAALLLLGAGAAAPARLGGAGGRVRGVLWLLSVAAVAGLVGLLAAEVLGWEREEDVALLSAGVATGYAAGLWRRSPGAWELVALGVPVAVAAGTAGARLGGDEDVAAGLAVWAAGLVWLALTWRGLLAPRWTALVLGGLAAVFGGLATLSEDWGALLAVATAAAVVGAAVALRDLALLAVGVVGTLAAVPAAVTAFVPGALAAPLALLITGLVLVVVALRVARAEGGAGRDGAPDRPAP